MHPQYNMHAPSAPLSAHSDGGPHNTPGKTRLGSSSAYALPMSMMARSRWLPASPPSAMAQPWVVSAAECRSLGREVWPEAGSERAHHRCLDGGSLRRPGRASGRALQQRRQQRPASSARTPTAAQHVAANKQIRPPLLPAALRSLGRITPRRDGQAQARPTQTHCYQGTCKRSGVQRVRAAAPGSSTGRRGPARRRPGGLLRRGRQATAPATRRGWAALCSSSHKTSSAPSTAGPPRTTPGCPPALRGGARTGRPRWRLRPAVMSPSAQRPPSARYRQPGSGAGRPSRAALARVWSGPAIDGRIAAQPVAHKLVQAADVRRWCTGGCGVKADGCRAKK
jgi:hypothetical protein